MNFYFRSAMMGVLSILLTQNALGIYDPYIGRFASRDPVGHGWDSHVQRLSIQSAFETAGAQRDEHSRLRLRELPYIDDAILQTTICQESLYEMVNSNSCTLVDPSGNGPVLPRLPLVRLCSGCSCFIGLPPPPVGVNFPIPAFSACRGMCTAKWAWCNAVCKKLPCIRTVHFIWNPIAIPPWGGRGAWVVVSDQDTCP